MNNEIKKEMENIEIPKELHSRTELGIKQVKRERNRSKRSPKWIVGTAAASFIFLGAVFSIGGSHITDAAETFLGKLFSTEEQNQIYEDIVYGAPDPVGGDIEARAYLKQMNERLQFAEKYLSPEEFEHYSQLIAEVMKIDAERLKDPTPNLEEYDKQINDIMQKGRKYTDKLNALTNHTLEEAQALASYPINRPTYVPNGYELEEETAQTTETQVDENPVVVMKYGQQHGESAFYTTTKNIDDNTENLNYYDHIDSYERNGYAFEHAYDDSGNVQGMKITVLEDGYEIVIHADMLSKEEMEKVLLSMVQE